MKFKTNPCLKLTICLLLLKAVLTSCNNGCIRCENNDVCKLCDFQKGFGISNGSCFDQKVQNCEVYAVSGTCLVCPDHQYYDPSVRKCAVVPANNQKLNCKKYQSISVCSVCEKGYFIFGLECSAISTTIANCDEYQGTNTCLKCQSGYLKAIDNKSCISINDTSNCATFTNIQCHACKATFIFEEKSFEKQIQFYAKNTSSSIAIQAVSQFEVTQVQTQQNCLPSTNGDNCLQLLDFYNCSKCKTGFFVQNGKCVANPEQKILNCLSYKNLTQCKECIQSYYLNETLTQCLNVFAVKECEVFSAIKKETFCLKCNTSYFLVSKNVCQQRVNVIQNCASISQFSDKCSSCQDSYQLTTDSLKCLSAITNCQEYYVSSGITNQLICKNCASGNYLNNELCVGGTQPNCLTYRRTENICAICNNGHYLDANNNCLPHDLIVDCVKYDKIVKNKCVECSNKGVLFNKVTKCSAVSLQGCDVHNSTTTCARCNDGYMLNIDHTCSVLDSDKNCVRGEYGLCKKCKTGFMNDQGKCVTPYEFFTQNCESDNLDGITSVKNSQCQYCKNGSVPIEMKGRYACIKNSEMLALLDTTLDTNCKAYKLNQNGQYQCDICVNGKVVVEGGICQDSCPIGNSQYVATLSIKSEKVNVENVNYCGQNQNNCAKFGLLLLQTDLKNQVQYECVDCDTSFIKHIEYKGEYDNNTIINANAGLTEFYGLSQNQCITGTQQYRDHDDVSGTKISNCEYFMTLPDTTIGCAKCNVNFSGIVKNFHIFNCLKYSERNQNCTECILGYKIANSNMRCDLVTDPAAVNDCDIKSIIESKCFMCKNTFYMNDAGTSCTTLTTVNNCEIYAHNANECEKCAATHYLKNDKSECYLKIPNCEIHKNTVRECELCEEKYYSDTDSTCGLGSNPASAAGIECWIFEKATDKCVIYKNKIPLFKLNQCDPVTAITHCIEYSNTTTCTKCDSLYYLTENLCCKLQNNADEGEFGNPCATHTTKCLKFEYINPDYLCVECVDGYYFDLKQVSKKNGEFHCVPYTKFYSATATNNEETDFDTEINTVNCLVYDLNKLICLTCKDNFYLQEEKCIAHSSVFYEGETYVIATQFVIADCLEADPSNILDVKCTKCATGKVLTNERCCASGQYYSAFGACVALPNNCQSFDINTNRCGTCNTDTYQTVWFGNCCDHKQYSNDDTTCAFNNTIKTNYGHCLRYEKFTDTCLQCEDQYTWNLAERLCIQIANLYKNCHEVDSTTNKCKTCEDGYFLAKGICCKDSTQMFDDDDGTCKDLTTAVTSCQIHTADSVCSTCNSNFYKVKDTLCCQALNFEHKNKQNSCVSIENHINNCAYFSSDNQCIGCAGATNNNYYTFPTQTLCCQYGEKETSGACVTGSTGCAKSDLAGTGCTECFDTHFLVGTTCTQKIDNCLKQTAAAVCLECKYGYVAKDSTACLEITLANDVPDVPYYFAQTHITTVYTCRDFYHLFNTKCCHYHEYLNAGLCVANEKYPNCATYNSDSNIDCNDCFLTKNWCTTHDTEVYQIKNSRFGLVPENATFKYSNSTANVAYFGRYNSDKHCCNLGTYFKATTTKCETIPIKNCNTYTEVDKQIGTCALCKDGYSGQQILNMACCKPEQIYDYYYQECVNHDSYLKCPTGTYNSKGTCCKEYTYWDVNNVNDGVTVPRCLPNFDINCKERTDEGKCKTCRDDFALDDKYTTLVELDLDNPSYCTNPRLIYEQKFCFAKAKIEVTSKTIFSFPEITFITDNCYKYNYSTKQCDECISTAYYQKSGDKCCKDGEASFEFNEIHQCIPIPNLMDNCINMDQAKRQCLKCETNYHLTGNRCCLNGTFLDRSTMTCAITDQEGCDKDSFNMETGNCTKCDTNSYRSNGHCCQVGKFWDEDNNQCAAFSDVGLLECQKLGSNGECQTCVNGYYVHKGKCCLEGLYWNYTECTSIQGGLGDSGNPAKGFNKCQQVNERNLCKKCDTSTGFYLTKQHCCGANDKFVGTECIVHNVVECTKVDDDGNCEGCTANNYPVTKKNVCCAYEKVFNKQFSATECTDVQMYPNCLTIHETDGDCLSCESTHVLYQDTSGTDKVTCVTRASLAANDITNCNDIKYDGADVTCTADNCDEGYLLAAGPPGTCTAFTDDTLANCKIASADTASSCTECKSGFGLYNNKLCQTLTHLNCAAITTDACTECNDGYYLESAVCKEINDKANPGGDLQFCLRGTLVTTTYACTKCTSGYYNNTGACEVVTTTIPNCATYDTISTCVDGCETGYYNPTTSSGAVCCPHKSFYKNSVCEPTLQTPITNCNKFKFEFDDANAGATISIKCDGCKTNNLVNGGCCPNQQFWDGQSCITFTESGLSDCKEYENDRECKLVTDIDTSCVTGTYYFTFKHCCDLKEYYNQSNSKCENISTLNLPLGSCDKMNDDYTCHTCDAAQYLSNGHCCETGKHYKEGRCTTIDATTHPGCDKVSDEKCSNCATGFTINSNCCNKDTPPQIYYYDTVTKSCKEQPVNCDTFVEATQTCTVCNSSVSGDKYFTPKACCAQGKYFKQSDNTCADISTLTSLVTSDCKKVLDSSVADENCDECESGKVVRSKLCCAVNEYNRSGKCVSFDLISNCARINSDGFCEQCNSGYDLTGLPKTVGSTLGKQVCCVSGQHLDGSSPPVCVANANSVADCLVQTSPTTCSQCKDTFNLVNNNLNCCSGYGYWDGSLGTPACSTTNKVDKCINYSSSNTCDTCKDGFNLYTGTAVVSLLQLCCADGSYFDETKDVDSCIELEKTTEHCYDFEYTTHKCEKCSSATHYTHLTKEAICCPDGEKFINGACTAFTLVNCVGYSELDTTCVKCADGSYYNKTLCCPYESLSDGASTCAVQTNNCKIYTVDVCTTCKDNFNLYVGGFCCANGSYLDGSNACVAGTNLLAQCKKYKDQANNTPLCEVCNDGFHLSETKDSCCGPKQIVVGTSCVDKTPFPTNCQIFNRETLLCDQCNKAASFYNSHGYCCPFEQYFNLSTKVCTAMLNANPNCQKLDSETLICTTCKANYSLDPNNQCKQHPADCDEYNPQCDKCTKCAASHYLSQGRCCAEGEYNIDGTCTIVNPAIPNCIWYDEGYCIKCNTNHYLVDGSCCQNGKYKLVGSATCSNTDGTITNCEEYNSNGLDCRKCKDDYLLFPLRDGRRACYQIADQNCVQLSFDYVTSEFYCKQCLTTPNYFIATTNTAKPANYNYSLSVKTISNCVHYDIRDFVHQSTLDCMKCDSDHYVSDGVCQDRTNTITECVDSDDNYPIDENRCYKCKTGFYMDFDDKCKAIPITDCVEYDPIRNLCLKCDAGNANLRLFYNLVNGLIQSECKNVNISEASPPDFYPGFLPQCNIDTSAICQNVKYQGLSGLLDKFFNCHKCVDVSKIPITPYKGGKDYTRYPKSLQQITSDTIKYSECKTPSGDLPTNCALALFNSLKTQNTENVKTSDPNLEKINYFCVACLPGFKALRNKRFPLHVYDCSTITGCASSTRFNGCNQCNANFVFGYNSQTGVDRSICIDWTGKNANCFAVDNTADNVIDYKCVYCNSGYVLNHDNQCEKFQPPFCTADNFKTLPFFDSHDIETGLTLLPQGQGCSECENNYIGLFQNDNIEVCVQSPYVTANTFIANSVVYDQNCDQYGPTQDGVHCRKCKTNYVLTTNHKCVTSTSSLENCILAFTSATCSQCVNTHVAVNKKCVEKNIDNCVDYQTDPTLTKLTCKTCADGHYLHQNVCIQGSFLHCKVYFDRDVCEKCENGYALVVSKDEKEICFPVNQHQNCNQFSSSFFQKNVIRCTECESNAFILEEQNVPISVCNNFQQISNCIKYDNQTNIIDSSFKCVECDGAFYLTNNTCVERNITIQSCLKLHLTSQTCAECDENYYPSNTGTTCVLNPIGVPGCLEYIDSNTCSLCNQNLYLHNNKCFKVPEDNLVQNCLYYENSQNCIKCSGNFIASGAACITPTAENCATYLSISECDTCVANFGIEIVEGVRKCVEIQPKPNCDVQLSFSPFECQTCGEGFYLNNLDCIQAAPPIENCKYYTSNTKCSRCKENFVLNSDGTSCLDYGVTTNCADLQQTSPFCVLCQNGYQLGDNNVCQVSTGASSDPSCLVEDFSNPSVCLICSSGYYMNNNKVCGFWTQ